jgi:hypothetical protein
MARRTRWILLALVVVLLGAAVGLVVAQQPKLDDARAKVDTSWKPLVAPDQLVLRYQTLEGALTAFDAAGGKDLGVSRDLQAALGTWRGALRDSDAGSQADAANHVEAQGNRLVANGLGADRFKQDKALLDALTKYASTKPDPQRVAAYNRAVRDYQDVRNGALAQPVARVLGFDARPVFELGGAG